ncbi:MAG: cysteine synthase family protein [Flavobacteriales bacterium]|nr:cysteine synthase family protein [Flavobacteriales bacterium]
MIETLIIENEMIKKLDLLMNQVGKTPLLNLSQLSPNKAVKIYGKAEWEQLGGSVKARAAYRIIQTALKNGILNKNKSLLDASSGNTAIAYASIAKELGLNTTLIIPKNASQERKDILQSLGADLIYSSELEGTDGAQQIAKQLYVECPDKYFYADQYNNPENWKAHYCTTAPEIVQQTKGGITHFAASLGTTGTFTGSARYFKDHYPKVKLIQFQPNNPMHGLEGWKHLETAKVPGIFNPQLADENIEVDSAEAVQLIKTIYQKMKLRLSPSAAAAVLGSLQLANKIEQGVIVTTLADNGDKYSEIYKNLEL